MKRPIETYAAQAARYSGGTLLALGTFVTICAGAWLYYETEVQDPSCAYDTQQSSCRNGHVNPLLVSEAQILTTLGAGFAITGGAAFAAAQTLDRTLIIHRGLRQFETQAELILERREFELPPPAYEDIVDREN